MHRALSPFHLACWHGQQRTCPRPAHRSIAQDIVDSGAISNAQLETVVYANQRFQQRQPDGARAGFFLVRRARHARVGRAQHVSQYLEYALLVLCPFGLGCARPAPLSLHRVCRVTVLVSAKGAKSQPSSAISSRQAVGACCGCQQGTRSRRHCGAAAAAPLPRAFTDATLQDC